jgi:hypothetical protein
MKTAEGTEYPISNKEYPMSKERSKGNNFSIPWKLDLSVGYWMLDV